MVNSPARAGIDVGSVIAGTYKIEALLGRGGMGAVFLASHTRLAGKQVAIKILHTELDAADIVARFRREAEIAAKLNHPNIVGVIDYNVTPDGMPYLVLDYLEGETLAQCIARGPLPLDQVLSIVRQVGSALAAAHRAGIVHRDLKPQNIFLVPTEVDGRHVEIAKVLDFGISKIRGSQTVKTQDSALLGTPQYMAPEQATGQHANIDERTDVFALGAIVYEMLSGQPAFAGASIPEVVFKVVYEQPAPLAPQAPAVPPPVVAAVTRAMAKPSEERFATVAAFVEALTGQPLTLTRGQPPAPATAADAPGSVRRQATGEAFAQTMGSGDHGESPVSAVVATAAVAAPRATQAQGSAVPRAAQPPHAPQPLRAMPDSADTVAATEPPNPRRRSAGRFAAIAIAGVAIAGAVVYVATRPAERTHDTRRADPDRRYAAAEPSGPADVERARNASARAPEPAAAAANSSSQPPEVAAASPPAAPATTEHTATADRDSNDPANHVAATGRVDTKGSVDTKAHAGAKGHTDAKGQVKTDPRPASPQTRPPAPPGDDDSAAEGDDDIRDKLKQATAALDRHDYDLAERLATQVINSPAGPRQRAAARLIHGTVQCVARNDQEAAGIDLRQLEGFRALRTKLLTVCRSHGVLPRR
jgi:serine/threonine-protein kinase